MRQWFKTKLAEDAYLPTYSVTIFIVLISLGGLTKDITNVVVAGFMGVMLMLIKAISKLNCILTLLLYILKAQEGVKVVVEKEQVGDE